MGTLSIRLPDSIHDEVKKLAGEDFPVGDDLGDPGLSYVVERQDGQSELAGDRDIRLVKGSGDPVDLFGEIAQIRAQQAAAESFDAGQRGGLPHKADSVLINRKKETRTLFLMNNSG